MASVKPDPFSSPQRPPANASLRNVISLSRDSILVSPSKHAKQTMPSMSPARDAGRDGDLGVPRNRSVPVGVDVDMGAVRASMHDLASKAPSPARPPPVFETPLPIDPAPLTQPGPSIIDDIVEGYEKRIKSLEDRLKSKENDNRAHRSTAESLSTANATLHQNLSEKERHLEMMRREIAALQQDMTERSHMKSAAAVESDRRVEALIRENDRLVETLTQLEGENERVGRIVERQREEISTLSASLSTSQTHVTTLTAHLQTTNASLDDAQALSQRTASDLSRAQAEIDRLEGELRKAAMEMKGDRRKMGELKGTLDEVVGRYGRVVEEALEVSRREREAGERVRRVGNANAQNAMLVEDLKLSKDESTEIFTLSRKLEQRIIDLESIEVDCRRRLEDAVTKLEESHLDLEKSRLREQHFAAEAERARERAEEVCGRMQKKAEEEITVMRTQFLQDRKGYLDQISKPRNQHRASQTELDRTLRAHRSSESELQKLTKTIPDETDRLSRIVDDMATRLRISERERCEAVEAASNLQQRLAREMNRVEVEREGLGGMNEDLVRRSRRCERELEEAKEDAIKMMTKISDLEHEVITLKEEKHQTHIRQQQELSEIKSKHDAQISHQNSTLTDSHTRTTRELQSLLTSQHALSLKWKAESQSITTRYEAILNDLKNAVARGAERQMEMEETIRGLAVAKREMGIALMEERKCGERLRMAVKVGEERCEVLGRRLEEGARREREAVLERKQLQRDLDRLQLEKERTDRARQTESRKTPAPDYRHSPLLKTLPRPVPDADLLQAEIDRIKSRSHSRAHFAPPVTSQRDSYHEMPTRDMDVRSDVKSEVESRILMDEVEQSLAEELSSDEEM
ncbi:hypothetical protein BC829DRAFT_430802 [Chytridium lagenaria]|nr:hypothetical protein BC829DRAFT_430802 [Chytridium lagenaria]